MKTKLLLVSVAALLALTLLLLTNCKKDKDNRFTVTGRVVDSCHTRNPVPNVRVTINGLNKGGLLGGCHESITETATTDKDGKFSITYTSKCRGTDISLEVSTGGSVNGQVLRDDENVGDIVLHNNTSYSVVLSTDTAYSASDTLFYNISRPFDFSDSTFRFIPGPFTNGQVVDTMDSTLRFSSINGKNFSITHRWILKSGSRVYKPGNTNSFNFILSTCGTTNKAVLKIGK